MPNKKPSVFGVLFAPNASKIENKYDAKLVCQMAITLDDYEKYGCPCCLSGEKSGIPLRKQGKATLFVCAECDVAYFVVKDKWLPKKLRKKNIRIVLLPYPLRSKTIPLWQRQKGKES